eukprot:GHVH01014301.1.p1 GENE.GHVH01014301.1~~GHVH01014301.1.p1  ORF type:complete len:209 (+),score=2.31 GHVH01014301.1:75-629(+)
MSYQQPTEFRTRPYPHRVEDRCHGSSKSLNLGESLVFPTHSNVSLMINNNPKVQSLVTYPTAPSPAFTPGASQVVFDVYDTSPQAPDVHARCPTCACDGHRHLEYQQCQLTQPIYMPHYEPQPVLAHQVIHPCSGRPTALSMERKTGNQMPLPPWCNPQLLPQSHSLENTIPIGNGMYMYESFE